MPHHNYPRQVGLYAVKVKTGQSTDRWSDFENARFQISVGRDYHEGDKLEAMIGWALPRFEHIQICVNDTLQRFNLMFEEELDEEDARMVMETQGNAWITRNQHLWADHPRVDVSRWNDWMHGDFAPVRLKIQFLYEANPEFRQAIEDNITAVWERRRRACPALYTDEAFDRFAALSRRYLLEEISGFSLMFEQEEAIDVYPGTTLFAATVFQGEVIPGAPKGLGKGHFCRIDFSRNHSFEPPPPGG